MGRDCLKEGGKIGNVHAEQRVSYLRQGQRPGWYPGKAIEGHFENDSVVSPSWAREGPLFQEA